MKPGNRFGQPRLVAGLLLAAVFLTGGIAGVAANEVMTSRETSDAPLTPEGPDRLDRPSRPDRAGRRGEPRRSMAVMLQRRIGLSDEQREQVETIFESRRVRTEAVLRELEPRLQAQRDSTDMEIRAILTPEQVEQFDRMILQRQDAGRSRGPSVRGSMERGAGP